MTYCATNFQMEGKPNTNYVKKQKEDRHSKGMYDSSRETILATPSFLERIPVGGADSV